MFPGFSVESHIANNPEAKDKRVIIGPGIRKDIDDVRAIKCGLLRNRVANNCIVYWIDSHQKRVSQDGISLICLRWPSRTASFIFSM